ncbi:acetamidase/formamidase family protein [Pullulanibacillus sp. KACC 23026]|uniref:acetamidase/formamidase family protein n=1 Tax=Pullulanibacillus sp. KACC 23026 TaxID=3028315 RepID=UPI0023B122B2|nr:acetamidase/formamidase family protein [Pullulanibacillus sp. KACC 23026]WEG11985.1 acetamidase/formamidase family protein [Pullulanibacillus sp. KACC 23026]
MTEYWIRPEQGTLHGSFSREAEPVLTIDSGDIVRFQTLDAGWGVEPHPYGGGSRKQFEPRNPERDRGHALCGPVKIRGAEPGMTLEVKINEILPGSFGWTSAGGFSHPINISLGLVEGESYHLNWSLDTQKMIGTSDKGHKVTLRPFMGLMGMPPDEPGIHPTSPPRFCGGNIDCKELVAGSTLYLPIAVSGGLFSTGDGHGVQGDGEVACPALECPMDLVELKLTVREEMHLKMPRANTPAGWITMGFDEDLNKAMVQALDGMLDLMTEFFGYERKEALALASLVVDLRVTQVVNGVRGVHAVLPHGAIK